MPIYFSQTTSRTFRRASTIQRRHRYVEILNKLGRPGFLYRMSYFHLPLRFTQQVELASIQRLTFSPIATRIRDLPVKASKVKAHNHPPPASQHSTCTTHVTSLPGTFQLNTTTLPVGGIGLFVINSAKQMETVYDDLNSGAVLYNIRRPECQANWTVSVAS